MWRMRTGSAQLNGPSKAEAVLLLGWTFPIGIPRPKCLLVLQSPTGTVCRKALTLPLGAAAFQFHCVPFGYEARRTDSANLSFLDHLSFYYASLAHLFSKEAPRAV